MRWWLAPAIVGISLATACRFEAKGLAEDISLDSEATETLDDTKLEIDTDTPPADTLVDSGVDTASEVIDSSADADAGPTMPPTGDLTLWLRSDLGVTTSDAGVALWKDQSPGANDFAQADGKSQPTRVASGLNGLPLIQFDGLDDSLIGPTSSRIRTASGVTVVAVIEPLTLRRNAMSAYLSDCVFGDQGAYWGFSVDSASGMRAYNYTTSLAQTGPQAISPALPYIVTLRHDGVTLSLRLNNDAPSSIATGPTSDLTRVLTLGAGYTPGLNSNVAVGEVLGYGKALPPDIEQLARDYLKRRWGL